MALKDRVTVSPALELPKAVAGVSWRRVRHGDIPVIVRLANACNARIMRLRFEGGQPTVIAVDSQPTESFAPVRSQLPFAPGTRYDVGALDSDGSVKWLAQDFSGSALALDGLDAQTRVFVRAVNDAGYSARVRATFR